MARYSNPVPQRNPPNTQSLDTLDNLPTILNLPKAIDLQSRPPNTQTLENVDDTPAILRLRKSPNGKLKKYDIKEGYKINRNRLPQSLPLSVLISFLAKKKLRLDHQRRFKNYKRLLKPYPRQTKRSSTANPNGENEEILKIKEISKSLVSLRSFR